MLVSKATEISHATIEPIVDFSSIKPAWRALESKFSAPLFLTWDWIAAAGNEQPLSLFLVQMFDEDGVLAGLAILCRVIETRNRFVRSTQLRLQEFGSASNAMIPIENTTMLIHPKAEKSGWLVLLKALTEPGAPHWDEFVVTNAAAELEESFVKAGASVHRRTENPSAYADLKALRECGARGLEDYLQSLSRNTRSQIKRSIQLFEKFGPVRLTQAKTQEDALEFFDALAELNEEKWCARGANGLKSRTHLYEFHMRLINQCFDKGKVELLRASAGDMAFGWLYNFIDRGNVLFDTGGFAKFSDNRFKPGLVTHALAIEFYLKLGIDRYDFLAGCDRYKFSLGQPGPDMTSFAIQRQRPMLVLEGGARWLKNGVLAVKKSA